MDIQDIEEEVYDFIDAYFKDYTDIIEHELDFIEIHNLITPKKNYLITFDFLNKMVVNFRNQDYTRVDGILKKLYLDINNLHKLYENIKMNDEEIKSIFQKKALKKSEIFKPYILEILRLKAISNISDDEKEFLLKLSDDFKNFRKIYYEVFYDIFEKSRREIYYDIVYILNSKLFYLDKILWKKTTTSLSIQRYLRTLSLDENTDSKSYLTKKIATLMPQTAEYDYFTKCLRIYK